MAQSPTAGQSRVRLRQQDRLTLVGLLLLVPTVVAIGLVVGYPFVQALRLSFTNYNMLTGLTAAQNVGFANYLRFLRDPALKTYLGNTAIWIVISTTGDLVVGMIVALLLNRSVALRGLWRGLALIPWVTPVVVATFIWRWIFDGQWGILDQTLIQLHLIRQPVLWLTQQPWVWPSVFMVSIWKTFPFSFVNLLAALQGIPAEIYEAAKIDGASGWAGFWSITLPLLRPILTVLILLDVIGNADNFAFIWTLTEGGPGITTTTLSPLVYIQGFRYYQMGYAASIAVFLMVLVLSFSLLYFSQVDMEAD